MPKDRFSSSQTMTMGAKADAMRDVPSGWMLKSRTRMAHEIPTMALVPTFGFTTVMPWIAPRTDWAGVSTPSLMTSETPKTPINLSSACATRLRSRPERTCRFGLPSWFERWRWNFTMESSFGSRFTMLA